jgi:hypothetical protein
VLQSLFRGRTRIASKTAVVEKENGKIRSRERVRKWGAKRAISGVAVEYDDREFGCGGATDEPALQRQTVGCREGHNRGAFKSDHLGLSHDTKGKVDHPPLKAPHNRYGSHDHRECHERDSHSSAVYRIW